MRSPTILTIKRLACLAVLGCLAASAGGCAPPRDSSISERPSRPDSADSVSDSRTSKSESATKDSTASKGESPEVKVELASHAQLMERVSSLKGKVVVVDVWSTSCLPCMKEYPNLVSLSQRFPNDVACISFNVDYLGLPKKPAETYVEAAKKFLEEQKSHLINFVSSDPDTDVLSKFDVESMPAIMVFDRSGGLVAKLSDANAGENGLTYKEDVLPLVERLASTSAADSK